MSLRTEESSLRVVGTIRNIEGSAPVVDLKASSDKLAVDEIAKLVPALRGYELQPAFEIAARGPADRMVVDLNVREANLGKATGDLIVDADGADRRIAGTVSMEHVNVGALVRRRDESAAALDTAAVGTTGASAGPPAAPTLKSDITGQAHLRPGAAVGAPAAQRHV